MYNYPCQHLIHEKEWCIGTVEPVLKAYPTCYSWLITAHISLGNLDKHWKSFTHHKDRTQLLHFLSLQPNLNDIYTSHKPIITAAVQRLATEPSFDRISNHNTHTKRSSLPCLRDALHWLMGTVTTKDVKSIKERVNKLITNQNTQQETIVYIISILNITQYTTQFNHQYINIYEHSP